MTSDATFTLNTSAAIPAIGFGTWKIEDHQASEVVAHALKAGYRHIDTAEIYGNETGVGKGVTESGVARGDIFVTTKLWNDDQPYDRALAAVDESLDKLGLDYVDLYLVHWPQTGTRADAWRAMEQIAKSGKARAVGVSNYTVRHLEELLSNSSVVPAVNQVEFHPYIFEQQKAVLKYCAEHGIIVEAYSPLSRHSRTVDERITKIAERLEKSPSQIILRWCLQHGTVPLPRSTSEEHIAENYQIFDFELGLDDMASLDAMSDGERVTSDPEEIA